ncbi:MAG: glycosyltransferase [Pseudomonadota bacterium]
MPRTLGPCASPSQFRRPRIARYEDLSRGVTARGGKPVFVENPLALLARARLLALSSVFEGMPVVWIEAVVAGCPVVAADCPTGPCESEAGKRCPPPSERRPPLPMTLERCAARSARAGGLSAPSTVSLYRALLGV